MNFHTEGSTKLYDEFLKIKNENECLSYFEVKDDKYE